MVKGKLFLFLRAELATEEYIAIQDTVLENFIIVKKNPDYVEDAPQRKNT